MAISFDIFKPREEKQKKVSALGKLFTPLGVAEVLAPEKYGEDTFKKFMQSYEAEKKKKLEKKDSESRLTYKLGDVFYNAFKKYQEGVRGVEKSAVTTQEQVLPRGVARTVGTLPTKLTSAALTKLPEFLVGSPEEYQRRKEIQTKGTPEQRAELERERNKEFIYAAGFSTSAPGVSSTLKGTKVKPKAAVATAISEAEIGAERAKVKALAEQGDNAAASRYYNSLSDDFKAKFDLKDILDEALAKVEKKVPVAKTVPQPTQASKGTQPPVYDEFFYSPKTKKIHSSVEDDIAGYTFNPNKGQSTLTSGDVNNDFLPGGHEEMFLRKGSEKVFGGYDNIVRGRKNPDGSIQLYFDPDRALKLTDAERLSVIKDAAKQLVKQGVNINTPVKVGLESAVQKGKYLGEFSSAKTLKELVAQGGFSEQIGGVPKSTAQMQPSTTQVAPAGSVETPVGTKPITPVAEAPIVSQTQPPVVSESQVPGGGGKGPSSVDTVSAIDKVVNGIEKAKPLSRKQRLAYSEELAEKFGKAKAALSNLEGGEAISAAKKAMGGKLKGIKYQPLVQDLTIGEQEALKNQIVKHPYLSVGEKLNASRALDKLLNPEGVAIPTKNELGLLQEVYGSKFIEPLLAKEMTLLGKSQEVINKTLASFRTLMTGLGDMSYGLRQGVFGGYAFPKKWLSSFKQQFSWFRSEAALQKTMQEIRSRPYYQQMKQSGVAMTDLEQHLGQREEQFMQSYAEQIPGVKHIIRATSRAFVGFANKFRADLFGEFLRIGKETGEIANPEYLKSAASFINNATGRGTLKIPFTKINLEPAAGAFSTALFSPRLLASRLNLINPFYYAELNPVVRKQAIKALIAYVAGGMTITSIADALGADVSKDPTSSDFMKIRVGNIRIDPWGGFQQPIVLLARLWSGKITSSTTGGEMVFGEGYRPLTRADAIISFFTNKEAPVLSFIHGMLSGETGVGTEFKAGPELIKRFISLFIQDNIEVFKEGGFKALPLAIPGFFGMGVQAYDVDTMKLVGTADKLELQIQKLEKEGNTEKARELLLRNEQLFRQADALRPLSERRASLRKMRDTIKSNVRVSKEDKKLQLDKINANLQVIEKKMEDLREDMETNFEYKPYQTPLEPTQPNPPTGGNNFSQFTPRLNY